MRISNCQNFLQLSRSWCSLPQSSTSLTALSGRRCAGQQITRVLLHWLLTNFAQYFKFCPVIRVGMLSVQICWWNNGPRITITEYYHPGSLQDPHPLHAIFFVFFLDNKNIYCHFMSFLHLDMTQEVQILPQVRRERLYPIRSILSVLISWRCKELGRQQPLDWTEVIRLPHHIIIICYSISSGRNTGINILHYRYFAHHIVVILYMNLNHMWTTLPDNHSIAMPAYKVPFSQHVLWSWGYIGVEIGLLLESGLQNQIFINGICCMWITSET